MATIKDEIAAIAAEQGYEGDAPQTIAQAVNALGTVMGGGGSGGGMTIHGRLVYNSGNPTVTLDKTYADIKAYADAGNCDVIVYLVDTMLNGVVPMYLMQVTTYDAEFRSIFGFNVAMEGKELSFSDLSVHQNGSVNYQSHTYLL